VRSRRSRWGVRKDKQQEEEEEEEEEEEGGESTAHLPHD
jgi:hypothetical protein